MSLSSKQIEHVGTCVSVLYSAQGIQPQNRELHHMRTVPPPDDARVSVRFDNTNE